MRGDIFTMRFVIHCSTDFNYAIQERKRKVKRQNTVCICKFYIDWQAECIPSFPLYFQKLRSPTKTKVCTLLSFISLKIHAGFFSLKLIDPTYNLGLIKQMLSPNNSHWFPYSGNNCTKCSFDPSLWPKFCCQSLV